MCPRPSRSRGQQMEADEPQMAKSTTTTPLALLPGSRPWTQGRPLLESLVGRLGLASVSHLHVGDARLPFTRYKCVVRSPVSVTKQYRQHLHLIPNLGQPAGPVVASFSLLRTSVSNPRRLPLEVPRQCPETVVWRNAVFMTVRVSYSPRGTTKP